MLRCAQTAASVNPARRLDRQLRAGHNKHKEPTGSARTQAVDIVFHGNSSPVQDFALPEAETGSWDFHNRSRGVGRTIDKSL